VIATEEIEREFRSAVSGAVELHPEGQGRFRVFTPFTFDDGDLISPVLRNDAGRWVLSDEGNTQMRLSYDLDDRALQAESRRKMIDNALATGHVEDRNGELIVPVGHDGYGNALFSLVQAILRIMDVKLQTREAVRSTFLSDVASFVERVVPLGGRVRNWHDPELDPDGHYPVDWRVRTQSEPLFIFALSSEGKVKDATITLHQFEKWGRGFRTVGIFEDQARITSKTLARFTDVAEKNFSALVGNEQRIEAYLRRLLPLDTAGSN